MTVKLFRSFAAGLAFLSGSLALAQESFMGLYLSGQKIGHAIYKVRPEKLGQQPTTRSDSRTVMSAGLLGTAMTIQIDSVTWTNTQGRPVRMDFLMKSGGRNQRIQAMFGAKEISVNVDNNGDKTTRRIPIPAGARITDDPLADFAVGSAKPGTTRAFYILDPTTVSLIKNETRVLGKRTTELRGKKVEATVVEVVDPRANTKVFLSAKGDLLKVEGPMGILMLPETRAQALSGRDPYSPGIDLAVATSIRTAQPIPSPETLDTLTLRITGRDLGRAPSGGHQTLTKDGESWVVKIHPPDAKSDPMVSIEEAGKEEPDWLKPSLHIPASDPQFRSLAARIIGDESSNVVAAADKIRAHVLEMMRPNAGIGVLRGANEILRTKEGVCRDYAILTATIMRAGGIPTRLASGLVSMDGAFYYHAWCEYWNGERWIGLDSTQPWGRITPTHIKLAEGNVEEAFTFLFLDKVTVEVLQMTRRP